MKTLILLLVFATAACAPAETRVSFDKNGQPIYRSETAAEKTKRLAAAKAVETADAAARADEVARADAMRAALARLRKSAASNQDIADILLLLGK